MDPLIGRHIVYFFLFRSFREPHLICFNRAANKGEGLGIQVAGGNAVGIFVAALKDGSPAQVAGLRVGDQILTVSD